MGFLLFGLGFAFVACFALQSAFARLGRRPARALPGGSGHVLIHSNIEKSMALVFAILLGVGLPAGLFRAWQIGSFGAALYFIALSVPLGWLCILNLRRQWNVVELTETALTWRRGRVVTSIAWTDVSRFAEAPSSTAWIVRASDGETLRVDKLLIGVTTTFLDYVKAHLSASLYATAFAYVRPLAAQRARERGASPGMERRDEADGSDRRTPRGPRKH